MAITHHQNLFTTKETTTKTTWILAPGHPSAVVSSMTQEKPQTSGLEDRRVPRRLHQSFGKVSPKNDHIIKAGKRAVSEDMLMKGWETLPSL